MQLILNKEAFEHYVDVTPADVGCIYYAHGQMHDTNVLSTPCQDGRGS